MARRLTCAPAGDGRADATAEELAAADTAADGRTREWGSGIISARAGDAMDLEPGLHGGVGDLDAVRRWCERAGVTVFVLPDHIVDREGFFDAVRRVLPLDPPLVSARSWDALSDSVWEGLFTHPARTVAILWPGAAAMASIAPLDFDTAVTVLSDVARVLADPRATCGQPKTLAIYVEAERS